MEIDNVCRLCATNNGILYDLFDTNQIYLHYIKKIHRILPISINEYDPMPKLLCHKCAFKVKEFYEFRLKCLRTQDSFKTNIPWLNQNQARDGANNQQSSSIMVEVTNSPIDSLTSKEVSVNQDTTQIIIDDDDDDDEGNNEDDEGHINTDGVENTDEKHALHNSGELEAERHSNVPTQCKKPSAVKKKGVWHADNSNIFGKRRKRKKKSCRISDVFSTSTDMYQNLSEHGIIDPAGFKKEQDQGNKIVDVKKMNEINSKPKEQENKLHANIPETKLPEGTLVTKIPGMGNIYTCTICRRTFLGAEAVLTHDCLTREKEGLKPKPCDDVYVCDLCNKIFPRQAILIAHKKQHFTTFSSDSEDETFKEKRHYRKNSKRKYRKHKDNSENEISSDDS